MSLRPEGMVRNIPRLVVAGVSSGVGKTTVTAGLTRALRNAGHQVVVFKCGPDYLDPTYLRLASGSVGHNLDGWMMGREAVLSTFLQACEGASVALVEGVMGLFDGASPTGEAGSTAEIAKWLQAPVLLVADVSGMARTLSALVAGFAGFDPELRLAAVAVNRAGSPGHVELLRRARPPVDIVGGLLKRPELKLPERHLGLHAARAGEATERLIEGWAAEVAEGFDLGRLWSIAESAPPLSARGGGALEPSDARCRIGIARDEAFHFYYPDNLARLERAGAALVPFSPLADEALPPVDGLYLGGGYPELFAARLAANESLRAQIRGRIAAGLPTIAECGGMMYLCEELQALDGSVFPMVGAIGARAVMFGQLKALGYVEVETQRDSVLGRAGVGFRGHQFRYSELLGDLSDVTKAYRVTRRRGGAPFEEGYQVRNCLGSYVHAHWASSPSVPEAFVAACSGASAVAGGGS